jgi:hypothetical protein
MDLQGALQSVVLDEVGDDEINWALEKSRAFSTESLYNCLTHGGVKDKLNELLWKCKIPLKVKVCCIFKKRGCQGSPLCCVCSESENVNHLLFGCVFAQYVWCCIRDAFGLQDFPTSI